MLVYLGIGIVLWYVVRVAVVGRWRDFLKVVILAASLVPMASYAQINSNQSGGVLTIALNGNPSGNEFRIMRTDGNLLSLSTGGGATSMGINAPFGRGEFWIGFKNPADSLWGPWQLCQVLYEVQQSPGVDRVTFTGAITGVGYKYSGANASNNYLASHADPDDVNPASPNAVLTAHYGITLGLTTVLYTPSDSGLSGDGGGLGLDGFEAEEHEAERESEISFEGRNITDGSEELGNLIDDPADLFGSSALMSSVSGTTLPLSMPSLISAQPVMHHINAIMDSLLGPAKWSAPSTGGTPGKLFDLFQVSSWPMLIEYFIWILEDQRANDLSILFEIVQTLGLCAVIFSLMIWTIRAFNRAINVRHVSIWEEVHDATGNALETIDINAREVNSLGRSISPRYGE